MPNGNLINNWSNNTKAVSFENNCAGKMQDYIHKISVVVQYLRHV